MKDKEKSPSSLKVLDAGQQPNDTGKEQDELIRQQGPVVKTASFTRIGLGIGTIALRLSDPLGC